MPLIDNFGVELDVNITNGAVIASKDVIYNLVVMLISLNKPSVEHVMFFLRESDLPEHKCFYSFQLHFVNLHMELYCKILPFLNFKRDPSEVMKEYATGRPQVMMMKQLLEDVTMDKGSETPHSTSSFAGEVRFAEILLKYAVRTYLFTLGLHYVLLTVSDLLDFHQLSNCWRQIQRDINSFVSVAIFLYKETGQEVASAELTVILNESLCAFEAFLNHGFFASQEWVDLLKSDGARLVESLSELGENTLACFNDAMSELKDALNSSNDVNAKRTMKPNGFTKLRIIDRSSRGQNDDDSSEFSEDIFTMDEEF